MTAHVLPQTRKLSSVELYRYIGTGGKKVYRDYPLARDAEEALFNGDVDMVIVLCLHQPIEFWRRTDVPGKTHEINPLTEGMDLSSIDNAAYLQGERLTVTITIDSEKRD